MTQVDPKLVLQYELEHLYSKNQLIPRIRESFIEAKAQFGLDFAKFFKEHELPEAFGFGLLIQMVLHKRTNMATLVGILHHHFNSAQDCANALLKAAELDLVDYNDVLDQFVVIYDISPETQEELDRFQFPLPMVVTPQEIRSNNQSGYLLNNSSVILKDNHHDDDVCLDHLNRLNRIKFCINQNTAMMVRLRWKNLDKVKEGESRTDFNKRVKAFDKYSRSVKDVMAKLLSLGNEFYITHRYDKRGRTYSQGYHVNPQGTPWNKAVIELADRELVD